MKSMHTAFIVHICLSFHMPHFSYASLVYICLTLEPLFSKIGYRGAVVHGVGMFFERRRSGGLSQKWVNFLWYLCAESLFVFNLWFRFYYLFFPICFGCVLFSKTERIGLVLSFDFQCFIRLWYDLKVVVKRIFYPVLIWFGYRGFFLSHANIFVVL